MALRRYFFIAAFLIVLTSKPRLTLAYEEKIVQIDVAVTAEVKLRDDWQQDFERSLAVASNLFGRNFGISFEVARYLDWPIDENQKSLPSLIDQLMAQFPLKHPIVIGLSRYDPSLEQSEPPDLDSLGLARPFSGYMVIRFPEKDLWQVQQETVLVHEIGHLYGAIHTRDRRDIMHPYVTQQIPSRWDDGSREILNLTRDLDFKQGASGLSVPQLQALLNAYLKMQLSGQSSDFFYVLGSIYDRLGNPKEGRKAWLRAHQMSPHDTRIAFDLGVKFLHEGNPEAAIQYLSLAERDEKSDLGRRKILSYLGSAFLKQGNFLSAFQAWTEALESDPENVDLRMNLALLDLYRSDYDQAIRKIELLLPTKNDAATYSTLAFAWYQKGDAEKSLHFLEQALVRSGGQSAKGDLGLVEIGEPSEIHRYIGLIHSQRGQWEDAALHINLSCGLNPTDECFRFAGWVAYQQGDWPGCADAMEKISEQNATDLKWLGFSYANLQNWKRSEEVFLKATKLSLSRSQMAEAYQNLGEIYLQNQDWTKALSAFQTALSRDASATRAYWGEARAYMGQQDLNGAMISLKRFVKAHPDEQQAKGILSQLEQARK